MGRVRAWFTLIACIASSCVLLALIGVPSPTLFGGLCGALVLALLLRQRVVVPRALFLVAQATIGLSVAQRVDVASLQAFADDWVPILVVVIGTLAISAAVGQVLRFHGTSPVTAVFASIAGGASGMTALAHDLGADDRVVTVVQYLRVLVILLVMPVVVGLVFTQGGGGSGATGPHPYTVSDYLFVAVSISLGIAFGTLARLPSPAVLGTLVVGSALVLSPAFRGAVVPAWFQATAFILIGAQVGLRFTRGSLSAIGRMLPSALAVIGVVILACAGLGVLLSDMTGESRLDGYLATTPGGLPAVLAASSGTTGDVTFVAAVQLIRLLMVLLLAPVIARVLMGGPPQAPAED